MELTRSLLNTRIRSSLFGAKRKFFSTQIVKDARLAEVGKLKAPKLEGTYDTGQLILHKVFGYRGVILFPWLANVYDRDLVATKEGSKDSNVEKEATTMKRSTMEKEVKGKTHPYYQVLIDQRDLPFIRIQSESVTFLGKDNSSQSLYTIPGLDYAAHEDILPYTTNDKMAIQHELFDKFLAYHPGQDSTFFAQETLKTWQQKNHPWLKLLNVYTETTENIRVTVIPFPMGCQETRSGLIYWWRYCIRVQNLGELSVQLRERQWKIFSLSGTLNVVRGRGVISEEPILSKTMPAFQYTSLVSLQTPNGHMWGTFRIEREDGYNFDCRIPPFSLDSKVDDESGTPKVET